MGQETTHMNTEQDEEDLQKYVDDWVAYYRKYTSEGRVASYIPLLSKANPNHLGVSIIGKNGMKIRSGDVAIPFTIQSVSKVISFMVACINRGVSDVLERVDVEPSGEPFHSIMHLETKQSEKPSNPFINAGAITVTSMLNGKTSQEKLKTIRDLMEKMLGYRPAVNEEIYQSERDTSARNRAIGYYLLESGFLASDLDVTLDAYFKQCSIEITIDDLAKIGLILAQDGVDVECGKAIIPREVAQITKALMLTCGMYDASGKFATYVGMPAKSGVSGGIVALSPARVKEKRLPFIDGCGIGVFGPALDKQGNSAAGSQLLQHLASEWELSLF